MEPTVITSPDVPPPGGPYSPGLVLGDIVLLAGQGGRDPATGTLGETIEEQTQQTLDNIAPFYA
jgi:2-iminobutanoate/2-iminopropanoate deaminase